MAIFFAFSRQTTDLIVNVPLFRRSRLLYIYFLRLKKSGPSFGNELTKSHLVVTLELNEKAAICFKENQIDFIKIIANKSPSSEWKASEHAGLLKKLVKIYETSPQNAHNSITNAVQHKLSFITSKTPKNFKLEKKIAEKKTDEVVSEVINDISIERKKRENFPSQWEKGSHSVSTLRSLLRILAIHQSVCLL